VILRVEREQHAGVHGLAVQEDRACPTLAHIAGLLRTGQTEVFAQREEQGALVRDTDSPSLTIDPQLDVCEGLLAALSRSSNGTIGLAAQQLHLPGRAGKDGRSNHDAGTRLDE
jgi:hypothetical protein